MAACKYCGNGIEWEKDDEEKWHALNEEDGSRHYCDRSKGQRAKTAALPVRNATSLYREYTVAQPPEFPRQHDTQADILEVLHRIEALLEKLVAERV